LNWNFDFNDLLDQPLLMRDHLGKYRGEMSAIRAEDVIGQAALLWKMIYGVVYKFKEMNPEWLVVRHEDLSHDPVNRYRDLYASLGLDFTPRVEKIIMNSSSSENPGELSPKQTHSIKMDSLASVKNWKKRLPEDEINRIRKMTEGIAELYYAGEDWK